MNAITKDELSTEQRQLKREIDKILNSFSDQELTSDECGILYTEFIFECILFTMSHNSVVTLKNDEEFKDFIMTRVIGIVED